MDERLRRATWRDVGEIRHGLTHFELRVQVLTARVDRIEAAGVLRPIDQLAAEALPSVMRKCVALALTERLL